MNLIASSFAGHDVGTLIRSLWTMSRKIPGGNILFSKAIGRYARYTGSIGACVVDLSPGYARVTMADRAAVRNHLQCVHAMALANLAEITSGLGVMYSLPIGMRGILLKFEINYLKKARGKLTAESRFSKDLKAERQDFLASVRIFNQKGEEVASATATWRLGPSDKANQ